MAYSIKEIASVVTGNALLSNPKATIEHLIVDSRKVVFPATSLFFALSSERRDGAEFIEELYQEGVRNFIVRPAFDSTSFPGANFLVVESPLKALQEIAAYHRSKFSYPVIGITGSNGKTIVKEWLYQLLQQDYNIVRSPRSYNSQIGVPLSVWQMNEEHTLAIFEAGISKRGEMDRLERIIQPTVGVLTNIGEAHAEGFADEREKTVEKLKLFERAGRLIYFADSGTNTLHEDVKASLPSSNIHLLSWSKSGSGNINISREEKTGSNTIIHAFDKTGNREIEVAIPFLDEISVDNAITCLSVMLLLGYEPAVIEKRMLQLTAVEMRMQVNKAVNHCTLINDSYSNDLSSLELALDYLRQQAGGKKTTVILSDILQSGLSPAQLSNAVYTKVASREINRLILIGGALESQRPTFLQLSEKSFDHKMHLEFYSSTDAFLEHANTHQFRDEVILIKGARIFGFERINHFLEEKIHQTVMEINLNAMVHNLKEVQQQLNPSTKVMAMVKAFSYGSGSAEVASILQFNKVDYLAVAYADEGVELRKAGIHMPIMVMNPEVVTFDAIVEYDLEPELYSFNILHSFKHYLLQQGIPAFPVHIKVDTGMHRLGFEVEQVDELIQVIKQNSSLVIKSVFTHLVASEDEHLDEFTQRQYREFNIACNKIEAVTRYSFIKHLSNSAAIFRHPSLQCDMVRLGIGLYGVDTSGKHLLQLIPVATLTSTISQIRQVKAGESVGYNRKGIVTRDSIIATIRIGYADGFSRRLSNGAGSVYINGQPAPVIGNVCMDMTMIDITAVPGVKEGDKVEIFGVNIPVQDVAKRAGTIPYEILTGISQRVKRVYYEE